MLNDIKIKKRFIVYLRWYYVMCKCSAKYTIKPFIVVFGFYKYCFSIFFLCCNDLIFIDRLFLV